MPQFDFYSFATQVFYILLGFIFFHLFVLNYITVPYAQVLKLRRKLINTFLTNSNLKKNKDNLSLYDFTLLIIINYFLKH